MNTPLSQFLGSDAEELASFTDDDKRTFAENFVKNGDAYAAARAVSPQCMSTASMIAMQWPTDAGVLSHMSDVIAERGEYGDLPTKEDFALKLWHQADEARSPGVKLDFYKLFATVMGYVEKPAERPTTNVNVIVNKVMQVRRSGSDEEARERIASNQAKLINASA